LGKGYCRKYLSARKERALVLEKGFCSPKLNIVSIILAFANLREEREDNFG